MELTEDTLPRVSTRATVPAGVYFRLIVFRKSGSEYVFQSAADYTSNGTGTPVLKQGRLLTRSGTIRVVGYSFNTTTATDLGTMPSTYAYNSSTVSIPNMSKDFMTFDSGDITDVNSLSHNLLPVSFSQKLCKLTITISPTRKSGRTDGNCQFAQLLIETHRKIVAEAIYIRYISGIEGHEVLGHVRDRHCTAVVSI